MILYASSPRFGAGVNGYCGDLSRDLSPLWLSNRANRPPGSEIQSGDESPHSKGCAHRPVPSAERKEPSGKGDALGSGPARAAVERSNAAGRVWRPVLRAELGARNLAMEPWTVARAWLELERRHWTAAGSLLSIPVACPLRSDDRRLARVVARPLECGGSNVASGPGPG
jgi:hypothetical protein